MSPWDKATAAFHRNRAKFIALQNFSISLPEMSTSAFDPAKVNQATVYLSFRQKSAVSVKYTPPCNKVVGESERSDHDYIKSD